METIKMYLDNMFAALPKTAQMSDIKNNILANMEEKYNELKAAGKSENEAIGIVISEFGNIDELVNELGLKKEEVTDDKPVITKEETYSYLAAKKTMGIRISIGVFLCILAPASLVLLNALFEDGVFGTRISESAGSVIGLIPLFVLVTIAVGIFIYSDMSFGRYKYIEEGVHLSSGLRAELQKKYDDYTHTYSLSVIVGVCIIILSPITLFVSSVLKNDKSTYGLVIMLCIVAFAVVDFIYFGSIRESYGRLLQIGDYAPKKQKEDKVIGAVASIVWPLAVAIFLFSGFIYDMWAKAWVVFPITGVLFGMFSAAYSIITENNHK
jgi:hypothetical protein